MKKEDDNIAWVVRSVVCLHHPINGIVEVHSNEKYLKTKCEAWRHGVGGVNESFCYVCFVLFCGGGGEWKFVYL